MTWKSQVLGLLLLPLALPLGAANCLTIQAEGEGEEGEGEEGEGEEGEGEGDPSAAELADAFSTFLSECDDANPFSALLRIEPALFANNFDTEEIRDHLDQLFANPEITVNEEAYAACLTDLESCASSAFDQDSVCNRVFEGTRAVDDGCADKNVCQPGLQCTSSTLECGTCVANPALGGSCQADNGAELDCGDNVCDQGVEDTCVARDLAPGVVCDFDPDRCAEGTHCNFANNDDVDPTCVAEAPAPEVDDPCTDDCGGTFSGLACVAERCVLVTPVQPDGGACDSAAAVQVVLYCVNQIAGLNACIDADGDGDGVCTALPTSGPCADGRCASGNVCNEADNCVALPGAGQPCIEGDCAEDLQCNDQDRCEDLFPDLVCPA